MLASLGVVGAAEVVTPLPTSTKSAAVCAPVVVMLLLAMVTAPLPLVAQMPLAWE